MSKPPAALAAILLLPLAAIAASRPKDSPDEGLYFPTAVGTKWVYEGPNGEYEEAITDAKADGKGTVVTVVRTKGGKEEWRSTFRVTRAGFDMLASGGVTYEQPLPFLKAGAKAGDEWEYTYARPPTAFHCRLKVVGPEKVEVPAGKFDAVRVDAAESNSLVGAANPNGPAFESSCWYAPGVGLVRQVWRGQETTLKAFTPGK
jgi:hypothetical protein